MYPPTTETYTYCNPLSHHAALPCSFPADIRRAGPLQELLHAQRPAKPEPRSQATRPGPDPPAAGLTEGSPEGAAADHWPAPAGHQQDRSEEHTSELQSLMRISYTVLCLKKKTKIKQP